MISTLAVDALAAVGGRDQHMLMGARRVQESSPFHGGYLGRAPAGNEAVGKILLMSALGIVYFLAQCGRTGSW